MIQYANVRAFSAARERSCRDHYSYRSDGHTRDSDRLIMFTTENSAQEESAFNLEHFKILGRAFDVRYLVVSRVKIQFLSNKDPEPIRDSVIKEAWYQEYKKEHTYGADMITDRTNLGAVLHLRAYNHGLFLKEQYGVYDLEEDRRIKNREEIIRRFWDHGFATWRGRPPTVAQLRWSGPREHLEDLTVLADRYWKHNNGRNEVAKKIVSAFRSINRYAAWPGSW